MSKQHEQEVVQWKTEHSRGAATDDDNGNYLVLYRVRNIFRTNFFPR